MKQAERQMAISLRQQGFSLNEICAQVSASKSTVSIWVRGINLTEGQISRLRNKHLQGRERNRNSHAKSRLSRWKKYQDEAEHEYEMLSKNPRFMFGLALYIGEGSKYSNNDVGFANADPQVIRKAIEFFSLVETQREKIIYSIHTHLGNAEEAIREYWQEQTGLPKDNYRSIVYATSRLSQHKKGNTQPYGTCHLMVHSTRLRQKIKRWMELALLG